MRQLLPLARAILLLLAASARAEMAPRPVVVTIVVDQLGAWIADDRLPRLPETGGFARLRREGTWLRDVRFAHGVTDTAPGHTALYTGAPPREAGIVANDMPGPDGEDVSVLFDPTTRLVGADGPLEDAGRSLTALKTDTIADRLRAERPDAWIVSVSLKDRAALFGGGRKPDAVLFFEAGLKAFVTSTAFTQVYPAWAHGLTPVRQAIDTPWEIEDAAWVREHAASPDDQPGEGDLEGFGTTFPHRAAASRSPGKAYRATPASDEHLVALALAGLDAAPSKDRPVLLSLSLSAHDYVGHFFGPDSWEAWAYLRYLDGLLGRLLGELDRRFGADGYAVLLSADHGVTPLLELPGPCGKSDRWQRSCKGGERLIPKRISEELRAAARKALGPGEWVTGLADPYVYLGADGRALPVPERRKLLRLLDRTLRRTHRGIRETLETARAPATCPPESDESVPALRCRSIRPDWRGELFVQAAPGSFFDSQYAPGKGTGHGTPQLHDRTVPVLVRAPGRVAAGRVDDRPTSFRVFARTASDLLGIAPPGAAAGAPTLVLSR